jgi:hypothetical protein
MTSEMKDGPFEIYYENGPLEEKGTYKDNKRCGEWLKFGETGHLRPLSPRPRRRQLAPSVARSHTSYPALFHSS